MSALMMSCMSLLGRTEDRLLHVLVNPPFDGPMNPPFLFAGTYDQQAMADAMVALAAKPVCRDTPDWVERLQSGGRFSYARGEGALDVEGVRKCLSSARAKIRHHTRLAPFADALVPFRGKRPGYPHKRIIITGPDVFAGAHGSSVGADVS
ncbi:MAG: hypothetical protein GX748_10790 [Lentisphaerae bacterium]|jgi:hypothetical protein|nr:hypothetical protein [Lentisphaerota bacterium]